MYICLSIMMKKQRFTILNSIFNKTNEAWLQSKKDEHGTEGLWRIHDNLYDVSSFVQKHPGGTFWLETTKGLDITEAFESHHSYSDRPEQLLKDFYVRKAKTPRCSPYTFEENGFYKTLKRRVKEVLKTLPRDNNKVSNFYTDMLFSLALLFSIIANTIWSFKLAVLAGSLYSLMLVAAHNYFHKKDNFRMHYLEILGINAGEFRIMHVISHHFYPNSTFDLQVYFAEPLIVLYPQKKSFVIKYLSWFYIPLMVFPLTLHIMAFLRFYTIIMTDTKRKMEIYDLILILLPLSMYVIGRQTLLATFLMWQVIFLSASFGFSVLGFTFSHIHPEMYIEGDTKRPQEEMDWGINQLDTLCDRSINGNSFLVLVTFGDHALHHLFPTLDHSILHHLYPIALKTMKEYNVDIRMIPATDIISGYFKRIANETKNPNPPTFNKSS